MVRLLRGFANDLAFCLSRDVLGSSSVPRDDRMPWKRVFKLL